jgi:hypothetical protein
VPVGFVLAALPVLGWAERARAAARAGGAGRGQRLRPTRTKVTALVDRYFELTLRDGNRRALVLRLQQLHAGRRTWRASPP